MENQEQQKQEITETQEQQIAIVTPKAIDIVKRSLKVNDVVINDAEVDRLRDEYKGLTITDTSSLDVVKRARSVVMKTRTGLGKVADEIFKPVKDLVSDGKKEVDRLTDRLEAIEKPLKDEIARWENAAEIKRQEKAKQAQKELDDARAGLTTFIAEAKQKFADCKTVAEVDQLRDSLVFPDNDIIKNEIAMSILSLKETATARRNAIELDDMKSERAQKESNDKAVNDKIQGHTLAIEAENSKDGLKAIVSNLTNIMGRTDHPFGDLNPKYIASIIPLKQMAESKITQIEAKEKETAREALREQMNKTVAGYKQSIENTNDVPVLKNWIRQLAEFSDVEKLEQWGEFSHDMREKLHSLGELAQKIIEEIETTEKQNASRELNTLFLDFRTAVRGAQDGAEIDGLIAKAEGSGVRFSSLMVEYKTQFDTFLEVATSRKSQLIAQANEKATQELAEKQKREADEAAAAQKEKDDKAKAAKRQERIIKLSGIGFTSAGENRMSFKTIAIGEPELDIANDTEFETMFSAIEKKVQNIKDAEQKRIDALLPDKEKLTDFVFRFISPVCADINTPEGKAVLTEIGERFDAFKTWAEDLINTKCQ